MRCVTSLLCFFFIVLLRAPVSAKGEPMDKKKTLAGEIIDFKRKLTVSKLYSSMVPPSDGTKKVISVKKYLMFEDQFAIDPEKQLVTFSVSDCDNWKDSRLEWEKENTHVEDLLIPQYGIWKPNSVYSAPRKRTYIFPSYLEHHGNVVGCDSYLVALSCSFDLRHFPKDTHKCVFKTHSRSYRIDELEYDVIFSGLPLNSEWMTEVTSEVTAEPYANQGNFSMIAITLNFHRRPHLFGSRVYLPLWSVIFCSVLALHSPESSRVTVSSLTLVMAFLQNCSLLRLVKGSTSVPRIVIFSSVLVVNSFCLVALAGLRAQLQKGSATPQRPLAQFASRFAWIEKLVFLPVSLILACTLLFL